ncbi:NUDIX hydrolase [Floccifex sp.]|uniref:NUDIX hydrolase n=1 Tax=Floccifex sp. TaxID=2815810 RepID=UPI003F07F99B
MEYWDIYDKNKQLTGRTMKKNDWKLKEGEYHLSVIAILQRNDGKYLITQRVMSKSWAPGWWEVPGGACIAGETSKEAIVREVKEETGLDVSHAKGGLVFTYHRENIEEGDNYFVDVYKFILDFDESDLQIQKEEALGYKICTKEELEPLKDTFLHYYSIEKAF